MQFELTREYIDILKNVIATKDKSLSLMFLDDLHAYDIADIYREINIDEAKFLYLIIDKQLAADVIIELEGDERERFLRSLPSEIIASHFINEMDSDDAADVLGELSDEKQGEILQHMTDLEQAGDIVDLLNYDEDTAGGLMAKELVKANVNWSVTNCIKNIRAQAEEVDELYHIYVVDDAGVLKGTLSLKKLIISNSDQTVESIYKSDVISVKAETASEEVAIIMERYDLVSMPVVDSIGRLVGRITIDDVVDVIREEAEKDYQMISGITEDVESGDRVWVLTRARLPWLLLGLMGGLLGAYIMSGFEAVLSTKYTLAFFAPLIAAMGGNAGVQSSSIIVQGLANKTMGVESTGKKLLKEFLVALINGAILSVIITIVISIYPGDIALTITVSVALFAVILFATVFGAFIPLLLNSFKIDPAVATGPFITTSNDIVGLFVYFSIAHLII